MKNFFKKLLFIIVATFLFFVISLIILEIARRISHPQGPVNPLFSITQKGKVFLREPNSIEIHTSPETDEKHEAHINKYGYRGKDFEMPKPKDITRIFAVGDSFTHAVGMADTDTIPYKLDELLKEINPKIEVINAGVGHTSPVTHYINFKNIHLKYQPDLVLLLLDWTDLWDDWHSERSAIFDDQGEIERFDLNFIFGKRSWWRTCVSYSSACKFINNKHVRTFKKIQALGLRGFIKVCREGKRAKAAIITSEKIRNEDLLTEYDGLLMLRGRMRKALIDKHWRRTAKYITKIRDLLAQNNIPLILVTYPHGLHVGADEWDKGRETWGFEQNKLHDNYYCFELVESFALETGIPYISTLQDFLKAKAKNKDKKFFYDWDGHFNPEGNKIVAKSIFKSPVFQNELKKQCQKSVIYCD